MASTVVELPTTGRDTGKTTPEFVTTPHPPPTNFFLLDFTLRLFLLAATVSALVVLVTSKQTKRLPNPLTGTSMRKSANYDQSPAFIYLVSALAVTGFYSFITIFTSFFAVRNPSPSTKLLFNLVVIDALLAGVMASATGAAGAVAYIGLRGNSHVRWSKICNVYGRFCWHIGSSAFVSLVASIILVLLVFLSAYSLYRRSR